MALVGTTAATTGFPNASQLPGVIWGGVPTSAALFSFCFSGHAVSGAQAYCQIHTGWHGLLRPRLTAASCGLVKALLLHQVLWRKKHASHTHSHSGSHSHLTLTHTHTTLTPQVFPSLYASLRSKRTFGRVLLSSFSLVCLLYGAMAVMG